jgi:uncharacterized protein (TIGR03083 family)
VSDAALQTPTLAELLAALRHSHDRFVATVAQLSDDDVTSQSYCTDWTIAQVASHLGSGSEVFGRFVDAGLQHTPAPGVEQFQPIWDRWNAKPPHDQVRDSVPADAAFLDRLDAVTDGERDGFHLDMFGSERSLPDVTRMRLAEHTVHTWDIAVVLQPDATLPADAVALLVDTLPALVERVGKAAPSPVRVHVITTGPTREFLLELSDAGARLTSLDAAPTDATGVLRLPAEAFLRLAYGRLDASHTPSSVESDGIDLKTLRNVFPGF